MLFDALDAEFNDRASEKMIINYMNEMEHNEYQVEIAYDMRSFVFVSKLENYILDIDPKDNCTRQRSL